jgi:predicted small secreted protein
MLAVALLLIGCNTVAGFGKDVAKAGSALERAADKSKK